MLINKYTVTKMVSIRPNKIVFYDQFHLNSNCASTSSFAKISKDSDIKLDQANTLKRAVEVNKHNFEISPKASQNIKQKISWLYQLAKTKTRISASSGKQFSYKINFITLTLPSVQVHDTATITAECLNQFLTECKTKFNMTNYVWRLEFQKNGNVHYHIATDCYAEYTTLQTLWNRIINKLGYVSAYQDKWIGISFRDYVLQQNKDYPVSIPTLKKRWKKGNAFHWSTPNTVDVRAVANHKSIAFYISKYITKKSENLLNPLVSQRENLTTNLRLWFCSRSLSKLDKISIFYDEIHDMAEQFHNSIKNAIIKIFDYCKVLYFTSAKESYLHRRTAWLLFNNYASGLGYVPA